MPRIDAIATVVEDMELTLGFYRLLGFDIPVDADDEGYVVIDLGCGLRFAWNTEEVERSFNPEWQAPPIAGRMGITFRCESASEVDAAYSEIVRAGYDGGLAPFDAPWGSRHCRVLDPDGNAIDLFAPLP
ncbi:MAG: VOC family protein [Actinomycetota bacterium]|nr:VOC family protein [Actinomycetota bacterium]